MVTVVAHADWSTDGRKRWVCVATRLSDGPPATYRIAAPKPVGDLAGYFDRLNTLSSDGSVLAGFDFPLGVPLAYAERSGITSFRDALRHLGHGDWNDFFDVCATPADIRPRRPFYPQSPKKGTSQRDLCAAIGVDGIDALMRRCDRKTSSRSAAGSLFWLVGPKQVGRAAITGWRDLIQPAAAELDSRFGLWPFDGELASLIGPGRIVVAESYPAESGLHIGLPATGRGWKKGNQSHRASHAARMLSWSKSRGVALDPALQEQMQDGFGTTVDGEDRFDATVGVMGMLEVVLGGRPAMPELPDRVRIVEGWILGQSE